MAAPLKKEKKKPPGISSQFIGATKLLRKMLGVILYFSSLESSTSNQLARPIIYNSKISLQFIYLSLHPQIPPKYKVLATPSWTAERASYPSALACLRLPSTQQPT